MCASAGRGQRQLIPLQLELETIVSCWNSSSLQKQYSVSAPLSSFLLIDHIFFLTEWSTYHAQFLVLSKGFQSLQNYHFSWTQFLTETKDSGTPKLCLNWWWVWWRKTKAGGGRDWRRGVEHSNRCFIRRSFTEKMISVQRSEGREELAPEEEPSRTTGPRVQTHLE